MDHVVELQTSQGEGSGTHTPHTSIRILFYPSTDTQLTGVKWGIYSNISSSPDTKQYLHSIQILFLRLK